MALTTAPVELVSLDGTVTINDSSADVDFRVESNGDQHAIFVNAGDDRVTFFNSTTVNAASGTADGASHYSDGRTDISKSGGQPLNLRRRTDGGIITGYFSESSGSVTNVANFSVTTGGNFALDTPNGNFTINENSTDSDFRVESDSNTHGLFLEASTGNVMIGHSSQDTPVDNGGAGVTLRPAGIMLIGGTGTSIFANREDSDGDIIEFRKDGSTVGQIGTVSNDIYIGTGDTTIRFADGSDAILATGSNSATRDGAIDLGHPSHRF